MLATSTATHTTTAAVPAAWEMALVGASAAVRSQFVMRGERVIFAGVVFTVADTFRSVSMGGVVLIDMIDAEGVLFSEMTAIGEWVYLAP
jgi:hypothetical protein